MTAHGPADATGLPKEKFAGKSACSMRFVPQYGELSL
jgi:hypothetical protein